MKNRIPNLLSGLRLLAAPFMLYLSWTGFRLAFLVLLVFALLSDALDGFFGLAIGQKVAAFQAVTLYTRNLSIPLITLLGALSPVLTWAH